VGYDIARLLGKSLTPRWSENLDALPKRSRRTPRRMGGIFFKDTFVAARMIPRCNSNAGADFYRLEPHQEHASLANVMRFERIKKNSAPAFA